MFTHPARGAGRPHYPSACCLLRGAVGRARATHGCCSSSPCQPAEGSPSADVGDTKAVSHRAPRAQVGPPPSPRAPQRASGVAACFLLLLPLSLAPLSVAPRSSAFLLRSCSLRCRQPQPQPSWVPLAFCECFSPGSRLWLQPLQAGSPKTHDSLTMNNQYRY